MGGCCSIDAKVRIVCDRERDSARERKETSVKE